jgi:hypothetical protein
MGRRRDETSVRREPSAADVPLALPAPYEALNDSPNLIDVERTDLAACEAAIDGLRVAFWAAGKALQVIRDARLYRAGYPTFEEYCEGRWQMHRAYADKLIRAWPLAERLNPIGSKDLNEAQVRELLPVAARHGDDAAATVYETVYETAAEAGGVRVTAAVLKGAVGALPDAGQFDPDEAIEQIRAYVARLAAGQGPDPEDDVTAVERFTAEADRVWAMLRRAIRRDTIRDAAQENPAEVKKLVAELRALLDEVEQAAL